jgi:hypothetical protein
LVTRWLRASLPGREFSRRLSVTLGLPGGKTGRRWDVKALYWEEPVADRVRRWDQLDPSGLEQVLVGLVASATLWRSRGGGRDPLGTVVPPKLSEAVDL